MSVLVAKEAHRARAGAAAGSGAGAGATAAAPDPTAVCGLCLSELAGGTTKTFHCAHCQHGFHVACLGDMVVALVRSTTVLGRQLQGITHRPLLGQCWSVLLVCGFFCFSSSPTVICVQKRKYVGLEAPYPCPNLLSGACFEYLPDAVAATALAAHPDAPDAPEVRVPVNTALTRVSVCMKVCTVSAMWRASCPDDG